jgi:hypothetical protein
LRETAASRRAAAVATAVATTAAAAAVAMDIYLRDGNVFIKERASFVE